MDASRKSSHSHEAEGDANNHSSSKLPELPLPLLQEIDELINKEKTLLQLQLLDQELEAELWKTKYDELKEKVIDDVYQEDEDIQVVQTVADLEDQEVNDYYIPTDPHYLLISRIDNTVGNFSNINFTHEVFFRVMKELFSPRKSLQYMEFPEVTTLWLNHCRLDHSFADVLSNILKNPRLEAIDLSHNLINAEMMYNFITILSNRRRTPQYLLFHGNMTYAAHAKTATDFFKVLSEDTWGLSLSLQDYSNQPREMIEKELERSRNKSKKDESILYRDLVKPTLKAYHFLKGMNDYLYKLHHSDNMEKADAKKQKKSQKVGALSSRSLFPWRYLIVLGLTDCHLCRQSLDLLQESYRYLRNTLTELDLSYSYMGLYGLETINDIITDQDCGLITLNLKGNVLYDPGSLSISEHLKRNKSITNLNLSSNGISITAIRAMLNHLAKSTILMRVDLRTNDCTAEEVMEVSHKLQEHGSTVDFLFDEHSHQDPLLRQMMRIHPKFYCQPQLRKLYCVIGKVRTMMRIDFKALVGQYPPETFEKPLMIQWFFRPIPIVSFDQVQQTLVQNLHKRVNYTTKTTSSVASRTTRKRETGDTELSLINTTLRDSQGLGLDPLLAASTQRSYTTAKKILFEDPFLHINTLFTITFEVRLLHQNVVVWQFEKPFQLPDTSHRDFFQNTMEWFHCYEILPQVLPPLKGQATDQQPLWIQHCQLEIRVKCPTTQYYQDEHFVFDSTVQALHFQVKSCFATHFAMDLEGITGSRDNDEVSGGQYFYLGGDPREFLRRSSSILPAKRSFVGNALFHENEERNLAIQEAFERETMIVLFDPVNYWFQDHILLRCFEFAFAHITNRCKLRWQSKLYVKQYTLHSPVDLEERDIDEEAAGIGQAPNNSHLEQTMTQRRYPFRLDYRQILEDGDLMNLAATSSHRNHLLRSQKTSPYLQEVDIPLVAEELEEEEEEEEAMLYEELLEIDARKKRPKFYDYITYEWTVSLYEPLTNSRRVIETVCCDFQTEEAVKEHSRYREGRDNLEEIFDDVTTGSGEDGEGTTKVSVTVPPQLLLPWMWEAFEVEIDQLRPSDLIILSGRVIQKELIDESEINETSTTGHRSTLREKTSKYPRKKDLRRLIKYLSIQIQGFESYLYLENEQLRQAPREKVSEMIPFIYPSQSIYGLPAYELPYEQYLRHQAVMLEAEEDVAHPGYQQYFLPEMSHTTTTTGSKTARRKKEDRLEYSGEVTMNDRRSRDTTLRKTRREDSTSTSRVRISEATNDVQHLKSSTIKENIHENISY